MIHYGMYNCKDELITCITTVYASNKLDRRKNLSKEIGRIGDGQSGLWIVLGDFNNVLNVNDRI